MNGAPPIDITRAVRDELAVPGRYHLSVVPARPSLLDHVLQWLWDRWSDFWHMLTAHVKIGPAGAALVGDAVVVAAVVGVAMILAHLLVELQLRRMQRDQAMPLGSARSAHALANAAGWAADEGDYGRAIRLLFMAAVTMLDLRGIVRDERSATINDLRRELRGRDDRLDESFAAIARLYAAAAYAQTPADAQAWQRARHAYDELIASAV
ncbi:MAG TPA: DUF4129 domain-containing protein [Candidatus Acidoferrales bacterium]|nr:DUF4129 domain-containing protein [Candidatus Acidoferrales bacterium]